MKSRASNTRIPETGSPVLRKRAIWSRYSDIGLQRRVMAYAFIGLTSLAAIYAFVALDAVDKSTDAILRERLNLATTVARTIDQTIVASKSLVELTASDLASARSEPGELTGHEIAMLESLGASLAGANAGVFPESVILFDGEGQAVWESHLRSDGGSAIPTPELFDATAQPSVVASEHGDSTLAIGADISGDSELAYLSAVILPSHGLLAVSDPAETAFGEYRM